MKYHGNEMKTESTGIRTKIMRVLERTEYRGKLKITIASE